MIDKVTLTGLPTPLALAELDRWIAKVTEEINHISDEIEKMKGAENGEIKQQQ